MRAGAIWLRRLISFSLRLLAMPKIPLGMIEFSRNLDRVRLDDAKNAAAHPNELRLEVEDAMFLTLQKNGINLPDSFFTVNKNFEPQYPPQSQNKKN
jgi:hypothetical protein